jgi:starvation-inducible DNA-binding protein
MSRNGSKAAASAAPKTPAGFSDDAVQALSASFTQLLADLFALYIKTKNFHWHVSGAHFRDYHLLLDDQGEQIFATTDAIAERVRKVGGTTIRSIAHIARCQRVRDNDEDCVRPADMLEELRKDNELLVANMRETHALCNEMGDLAGASLLENWIDEGERRVWFLFETTRQGARALSCRRRGAKSGAAIAARRAGFVCRLSFDWLAFHFIQLHPPDHHRPAS